MVCLVCAGATLPVPVVAQGAPTSARDDRPFGAWTLGGIDLGVHDRWRVLVRLGYLGDVDSRILITELTFAAREAIHVLPSLIPWLYECWFTGKPYRLGSIRSAAERPIQIYPKI